jgi:hypothetical protein
VFLLWLIQSNSIALIAGATVMPLVALGAAIAILRRIRRREERGGKAAAKPTPGWRSNYALAALGFVVVGGVLPAIAFWKAAYHYQMSLYIKYGQHHLARGLEDRAKLAGRQQRSLRVGENHASQFLNAGLSLESQPAFGAYERSFFNTQSKVCESVRPAGKRKDGSGWRWLMAQMTLPFNQIALEISGLEPSTNDDPGWTWDNLPGRLRLRRAGFDGEGTELELVSNVPRLAPANAASGLTLLLTLCGTGIVVGLVFLLIRQVAGWIFLLDPASGCGRGRISIPSTWWRRRGATKRWRKCECRQWRVRWR